MSRDAKVGLVIVFAFVFLLGTILVHRMQGNAANSATAEGDMNDFPPGDESDDAAPDVPPGVTSPSFAANTTIVDAQPADDLTPPPSRNVFKPPANSSAQEPTRKNNDTITGTRTNPFITSRQTDPDESGDSGAHIALAEPEGERQPAAVVERNASRTNPFMTDLNDSRDTRPSGLEVPDRQADPPGRATPPLDIRSRPQQQPDDGPPGNSLVTNEPPAASDSPPGADDERRMPPDEPPQRIVGRPIPQLDTPPSTNTHSEPDEPESPPTSIQPAAGDRRPGANNATPPKLPKFGEPPEPTIDAVPDRGTPRRQFGGPIDDRRGQPPSFADSPNPRSTRPSGVEPEPTPSRTAGDKPYTVKDGDSFWSISAKQYGTGKYFRALEEYNSDRLVRPGGDPPPGEKQLVPGITIMLPDISILKMRSSPKATIPASSDSAKSSKRDTGTSARPSDAAEQSGSASRTTPASGNSSKSNVYIVEDGDTLTTIALRKLGTSKRWDEIYRLNQDRIADPNRLKVGTELKLPAASPENSAGQPRGGR